MSRLIYEWDAPLLRLKLSGINNHELRCLLLGLWRRLDRDDQRDFIAELRWYLDRSDAELPSLSQAIAHGEEDGG